MALNAVTQAVEDALTEQRAPDADHLTPSDIATKVCDKLKLPRYCDFNSVRNKLTNRLKKSSADGGYSDVVGVSVFPDKVSTGKIQGWAAHVEGIEQKERTILSPDWELAPEIVDLKKSLAQVQGGKLTKQSGVFVAKLAKAGKTMYDAIVHVNGVKDSVISKQKVIITEQQAALDMQKKVANEVYDARERADMDRLLEEALKRREAADMAPS